MKTSTECFVRSEVGVKYELTVCMFRHVFLRNVLSIMCSSAGTRLRSRPVGLDDRTLALNLIIQLI